MLRVSVIGDGEGGTLDGWGLRFRYTFRTFRCRILSPEGHGYHPRRRRHPSSHGLLAAGTVNWRTQLIGRDRKLRCGRPG